MRCKYRKGADKWTCSESFICQKGSMGVNELIGLIIWCWDKLTSAKAQGEIIPGLSLGDQENITLAEHLFFGNRKIHLCFTRVKFMFARQFLKINNPEKVFGCHLEVQQSIKHV